MIIFDGRKVAQEKEKLLKTRVITLKKKKDFIPKLVSLVVGDEKGAIYYQNLKRMAAERIGCQLSVISYPSGISRLELINKVRELNNDDSVHGVMLQLPLPTTFSKTDREQILSEIDPTKDVDGMLDNSYFKSPVVLSILEALNTFARDVPLHKQGNVPYQKQKVVVVGASGFEGRKVVKELRDLSYEVFEAGSKTKDLSGLTLQADIVISATGVKDLIRGDMVKERVVLIDIGYPEGDIEKKAYEKASFVSPVPGGIGPLTIYFLIENLVKATFSDTSLDKAVRS